MNPALGFLICLGGILLLGAIITLMFRYTSYWNRLEKLYLNNGQSKTNIVLTSLNIGTPYDPRGAFNNFRNMTNVGADEYGVYFSMIFPFRLIMRPIFIPWDEIIITNEAYIGFTRVELIPAKLPEIELILADKVVRHLCSYSKRFK